MVKPPLSCEQVREHFDLFEPYLMHLHESFEGVHPSEIYRLLTERAATLHIIGESGFFVAQWEPGEVFILAAAAWSGRVTDASIGDMIEAVVQYSRTFGIKHFAFASPRPAWRKIAARIGLSHTGEGHYERST